MKSGRWADVERVLDAVLDSEPREWASTIAALCGADAELRAEVESLVASHDAAQRFLEVPAAVAIAAGWGGFADGAPRGETDGVSSATGESSATDPLLGTTVGHYRIEKRLGSGGMGVVYRARDTRLEREVALKFLPPHLGLDPDARSRFLVEARAAAALDHPNICTVHEIGEAADGRLFIAMACYNGRTLQERIAEAPLRVEEALAIAGGIARGLASAHARGVVHRDVKPANVMLTADGGVKLLDFGLAKWSHVTHAHSGVTPGTVAYMSPEQVRGEDVDARTDLWSLGVVLYEMLGGARPFQGRHTAAVMRAILRDEPVPLVTMDTGTTAGLGEVIHRLLAKPRTERYPDARSLLADLEQLPATARPALPAGGAREPSNDSSGRTSAVVAGRGPPRQQLLNAVSWKRSLAFATLLFLASGGWIAASRFAERPADIRRIAMLPLANLTRDPELDSFADGMHYALGLELAKFESLTVSPRQSVMRYRGSDRPLPEIARELGVDALLEGAVFRNGDSVRITVQLLRARPEEQLLAASHSGLLSHALVLHNVVARDIADAVHARLSPAAAQKRQAAERAVNPAAEKEFLTGLYHLEHSIKAQTITGPAQVEILDSAIRHFQAAIALDSQWAVPHGRLSTAYRSRAHALPANLAIEDDRKAKASALRGIELDANDPEAHASLASVLLFHERDWAGAERAIRRSLELDRNTRALTAATYMTAAGRHEEAIPLWRRAEARYPLSEPLKSWASTAFACAGLHDEAVAQARELNDRVTRSGRTGVPGDSSWLLNFLANEHSMNGAHAEAVTAAEALFARGGEPEARITLAFVYARAGRRAEARALMTSVEADARSRGGLTSVAHVYAALGDTPRALDMVEAASRERRPDVNFRCSITHRVLQDEPRMRELMRSSGFPASN